MRDYLLDLVEHTYDLGFIDLIKITGDDKKTGIVGVAEDLSVVIEGEFKNPVPEFMGVFGMPNLNKLKILLNLVEYREDAKLSLTKRQDTGEPDGIDFENKFGDFKNNYRFMTSSVVTNKLKTPKFNGANWHVEFQPTVAAIQRLRMQAQANAEEPNFQAKTENGHLKFFFGDHSTHAGNFVFHPDVGGTLKRAWSWPASQFLEILTLSGDKTVRISDDGVTKITVDSGIAVYNYFLLAQSK
jgi:hypothetical protein